MLKPPRAHDTSRLYVQLPEGSEQINLKANDLAIFTLGSLPQTHVMVAIMTCLPSFVIEKIMAGHFGKR